MRPYRLHHTFKCTWEGCPQTYVAEGAYQRHLKRKHFKCSCGRYFVSIPHHLGAMKRLGRDHKEKKP